VAALACSEQKAEPWKTDGKAWHLSQKSIPPGQEKHWRALDLLGFIGRVNKLVPDAIIDWTNKVIVDLRSAGDRRICRIITNKADALRVDLHVSLGSFTPTQVENLGARQEFARTCSSGAELAFWFQSMDQIDANVLSRVILAAAAENAEPARTLVADIS
jgi:hypothetical protein